MKPMPTTTLHIRVGERDQLREHARERIAAAERGEDLEDAEPVLNFESLSDFARIMTEHNIELLRAIARHEPSSIRAAAQLVDRGYKEVHTNLGELEALGVIEFEQEGRSKRPIVRFDDLQIEVSLVDDDHSDRAVV
jgi:predicted transcriptional regulator